MKFVNGALLGAVLAAGAVYAEEQLQPTDPNAIARVQLMDSNGKNTGILVDMAQGKAAYDAAEAEAAKAALVENFGKIEANFMDQGAADPASSAKPEIWANWADFLLKAKAGAEAAGAMDISSAETIGAGLGVLGGTCKDCHTTYRLARN